MANDNNESRKYNESDSLSKAEEDSSHNEAEALSEPKDVKHFPENYDKNSETCKNNGEEKLPKSLLNDLVADLYITSSSSSPTKNLGWSPGASQNSVYGDYTNIRATTGFKQYPSVDTCNETSSACPSSSANTAQITQAPVQNSSSSFSFKHFLNSSGTVTAPSTTVTSLDPMIGLADSTSGSNINNSSNNATNLRPSTGARPKVPQSASICGHISSLTTASGGSLSSSGTKAPKDLSASKMKRSPRFSSFDSQASLAEYVGDNNDFPTSSHISSYNVQRYNSSVDSEEICDDYFNTSNISPRAPVTSSTNKSVDYDSCQYLPRSFSNYELPTGTPRRRLGYSPSFRPNRLPLNYNSSYSAADFNLSATGAGATAAPNVSPSSTSTTRQHGNNMNDLAHGAAVLPDFVQDHWLDSWYGHDVLLNSPSNSPISDFVDESNIAATLGLPSNNSSGIHSSLKRESLSADCSSSGSNIIGSSILVGGLGGIPSSGNLNILNDTSVSSTMLPDFLSDGPIIHSSQRIADVAVGLPSNSIGSPDESVMVNQLSRVLADNDRLQQELSDLRMALSEQTRRANDLERLLQENHSKERNERQAQSEAQNDSTLVNKLQSQIVKMRSEMDRLRRENELLIEGGAVGGFNSTGNTSGAADVLSSRPSRSQNLATDLRLAASTAEDHLRQLLAGVDNLRQIASHISDNSYPPEQDNFPDFPEDCLNYEDYADTEA